MVAKSGDRLLRAEAITALKERLLPLALVVTPNVPEAETLVGQPVESDADVEAAAREIVRLGARAVVIKGGHRSGDAVDVLYDGKEFRAFRAPRFDTPHTHGTGCTFSAAIAASLAKGMGVVDAVAAAKDYVTGAIAAAYPIGSGHSQVHHFLSSLAGRVTTGSEEFEKWERYASTGKTMKSAKGKPCLSWWPKTAATLSAWRSR